LRRVTLPERGAEALFGARDENLRFLEGSLGVRIRGNGSELMVEGKTEGEEVVGRIFDELAGLTREGYSLSAGDVQAAARILSDDPDAHLRDYLPHRETRAEHNLLTRGQEIQVDVPEDEIADITLQPGEMSLHDVRIIHGSNPNPSDTPRIGYAIRYMTPEVQADGADHPAVLVRGRDTTGRWPLFEGPPGYASVDEALAAHQAAAAEHLRAITSTQSAAR